MSHSTFGPAYRRSALTTLAEKQFDVLVIGGGVVGAGAALDAASRGLKVALVEAQDFAAGTSGRSSKLIHGGLRYLEQMDFRLVREALQERSLLLTTIAPHLVRPVSFLLPLHGHVWERLYIGSGVTLYDTMGGSRALPRHQQLTRSQALKIAPALRDDALIGAIRYYDAQVDDARHTLFLARTAVQHGATVLTRAKATDFLRDGERVVGAKVLDHETGTTITIRASEVINATGVWTDEAQKKLGGRHDFSVRASKGIHFLIPRERLNLDTGLILRTEKSVLFVIPWATHWIIGTTDTPYEGDREEPISDRADIDYLLERVNSVLRDPITPEDVEGVFSGLRPLVAGTTAETAKLSREHAISRPFPGITLIAGGKLTTYRVMAKDVVDIAVDNLLLKVPESITHRLPLLGAEGYPALQNRVRMLAERSGLSAGWIEHLLGRYGSCLDQLLELVAQDASLGEPIEETSKYLKVEVVYAATHEAALHLDDVLVRRTRIAMEERDRGLSVAPEAARLMAGVLGWDEQQVRREVQAYSARVEAERASEALPRLEDAASGQARAV